MTTVEPMPTWLRTHLDTTRGAVTDWARPTRCLHCRRPVIEGLDAKILAFTATCDPWPLDPTGELLALLDGRTTYELVAEGGRRRLYRRPPQRIAAAPPGQRSHAGRFDTLATHRCDQPARYPSIPSVHDPPQTNRLANNQPPF